MVDLLCEGGNTKEMAEKRWHYISEGMEAEGHTPIYKMHKYFARRPQNVFAALVENYSNEGDKIFDPFCGGGVTMIEGASLGRHVIANDINPLAAFITKCETCVVPKEEYLKVITEILNEVRTFSEPFYLTTNRETGDPLPVRWYELAYEVKCPNCGEITDLSNDRKAVADGKLVNGWYECKHCGASFQAVSTEHVGSRLLTVTYKTTTRATQKTVEPNEYDYSVQEKANELYEQKIGSGEWFVPRISIPQNWDRQQEDCLIRKGFKEFSDFFTKRSLLVMSYFLKCVRNRKGLVSESLYNLLLLTFSATLRYTNNMTISTSMWQDGRPVAWAKHAYWMSYQYVEVNPIEYIEKRITAIKAALEYQETKFPIAPVFVNHFSELSKGSSTCIQLNQDSSNVPIPDESIDLVLTDPPYGGNVQYGELSAFWLAWIYEDLGLDIKIVTDSAREILVHRKNKVNAKTHQTYYEGLKRVYTECFRVLKKGQPLVFTFNSKDAKVWLAVLKAVIDSGFILEPEGVIYQSPIEIYKNTAHTMASGTVHGDFIYTFLKPMDDISQEQVVDTSHIQSEIKNAVISTIKDELKSSEGKTISELYIAVLRVIIPLLAKLALSKESFDLTNQLIGGKMIEDSIKKICVPVDKNLWKLECSNA